MSLQHPIIAVTGSSGAGLSTIRHATRILVFENGKVIESGTFDELVAQRGHFAELARAQFMVQEDARAAVATAAGDNASQL